MDGRRSARDVNPDLLAIVRERAERLDADVIGQVLTVSSAMNAIGAETLTDPTTPDRAAEPIGPLFNR